MRGLRVSTERRSNTGHTVGGHRCTDSPAGDDNSALRIMAQHHQRNLFRILGRATVRPGGCQIGQLVPGRYQGCGKPFPDFLALLIRSDRDSHFFSSYVVSSVTDPVTTSFRPENPAARCQLVLITSRMLYAKPIAVRHREIGPGVVVKPFGSQPAYFRGQRIRFKPGLGVKEGWRTHESPAIQQGRIMANEGAEDPLHQRLAAEQKIVHPRRREPEHDNRGKRRLERVRFKTCFVRILGVDLVKYALSMKIGPYLQGERKDYKAD